MKLISVQELKDFMGDSSSANDDVLLPIIEGVSKRFETVMNRKLEKTEMTEYFEGGSRNFYLQNYPVATAEPVSLTVSDLAQTRGVDYWLNYNAGRITFLSQIPLGDPETVSVTYTGGFDEDDKGVLEVPDDLKLACKKQCAFIFRKRKTVGLKSINMPDGSSTVNEPDSLLKDVEETLKSYRRVLI